MKKLLPICYLAFLSLPSYSQTFEEWWNQKETQKKYLAEQLAALEAYGAVLKEGYETVSQGLGLMRTIQHEDFSQHQSFYGSFSRINPAISSHPETEKCIQIYELTKQLTTHIPNSLLQIALLSEAEKRVILHICQAIQKDSDQILLDLESFLQEEKIQLNDSERLERIHQTQNVLQEVLGFGLRFYQECENLMLSRKQELQSITASKSLHAIHQN
ncbi:hypothetical protein [Algoriphagus vanfongensis]|uniref:hypothetical protein n=1 Tax=Algoriphagus vanfongensis TaxID=426371 RepID=UPI000414BE70|nr:hypothetical protein [Algoriphagus vanfongensis]